MHFKVIKRATYKKINRKILNINLLSVLFSAYIEFLITIQMVIECPPGSVDNTTLSHYINWILEAAIYVLIPGLFVWLFTKERKALSMYKFKEKWSTLYDNLKFRQSKANLLFNFFVIIRRIIYV